MNIENMTELQRSLDARIKDRLGDSYNPESYLAVEMKVYAFHNEMHELANEVGFFKVWKVNHVMDRGKALEELVDAIHFLLSLGLIKGYDRIVKTVDVFPLWEDYGIFEMFNEIHRNDLDTCRKYEFVFSILLGIAKKLDFSEMEIEYAYKLKNEKNHERQDNAY